MPPRGCHCSHRNPGTPLQQSKRVNITGDGDATLLVDAEVWPEGSLEVLSQVEAEQLRNESEGGPARAAAALHAGGAEFRRRYRRCREVLDRYRDFRFGFIQQDRGLKVR